MLSLAGLGSVFCLFFFVGGALSGGARGSPPLRGGRFHINGRTLPQLPALTGKISLVGLRRS